MVISLFANRYYIYTIHTIWDRSLELTLYQAIIKKFQIIINGYLVVDLLIVKIVGGVHCIGDRILVNEQLG